MECESEGVGRDGGGGGAVGVDTEPPVGEGGGDGDEARGLTVADGAVPNLSIGWRAGVGGGVVAEEDKYYISSVISFALHSLPQPTRLRFQVAGLGYY